MSRVAWVILFCGLLLHDSAALSFDSSHYVTTSTTIESNFIITAVDKTLRRVTLSVVDGTSFQWDPTGCSTSGSLYLTSQAEGPFGFNARYPYLFNPSGVRCDSNTLQFTLLFDPFYQVPSGGDRITIHISPFATANLAIPWQQTGNTSSDPTFVIKESARYVSAVPSSVRLSAEIFSSTTLLATGVLLRKPTLVAIIPRMQFFRNLATCEFNFLYNVGRLSYPLQVAIGTSAYQLMIPVSPLNFALFLFVVFVDCAIFFAWDRYTTAVAERNEALLPPGIREIDRQRLLDPAAAEIRDAIAAQERGENDFHVLKTLPSIDTRGDPNLSDKKKKRLEEEARAKLERTIADRQAERAAGAEVNGGAETPAASGGEKAKAPIVVTDSASRPYDAPDPPVVEVIRPDDEEAKAAKAEAEKREAEEKERQRLVNRTPDEVDRDLAAVETNPIVKMRIHARRLRRFFSTRARPLVVFFTFLGNGRLPSPYWFLVFLWAEPIVNTVVVVVWNFGDDMVTQVLCAISLAPWAFILLWMLRILLRGFPMRFWDEDEHMVLMEDALREERIEAFRLEQERKREYEVAKRVAARRQRQVAREAAAEEKKKAEEAVKPPEGTDAPPSNAATASAPDPKPPAPEPKPSDGAPSTEAPSEASRAAPSEREERKDSTVAASNASADAKSEGKPTVPEATKPPAADSKATVPPAADGSNSKKEVTFASADNEEDTEDDDDEAQAVDEPALPPRQFPQKPWLNAWVQGYGRWVYTFAAPGKVDIESKRKERIEQQLLEEREAFLTDFEKKRSEDAAKLNAVDAPPQTDEEKKAEEALLKTEDAPTADQQAAAPDSDDDSVITSISDSKKTGTRIYVLCEPLHVPSLPSAEEAKEALVFHRSYADLYWQYKPFRHWFCIVELVVSILFGIMESVRTTLGCVVIAGPALGLSVAYLVLIVVLRPAVAPLDNLFYGAMAMVYIWCSAWYTAHSEVDIDALEIAGTVGQNLVEYLTVIYLVLNALAFTQPFRQWLANNERVYFAAYPWLRQSLWASPLDQLRKRVAEWWTAYQTQRAIKNQRALEERRKKEAALEEERLREVEMKEKKKAVRNELEVPLLVIPSGVEGAPPTLHLPAIAQQGRNVSDDELSELISIRSASSLTPTLQSDGGGRVAMEPAPPSLAPQNDGAPKRKKRRRHRHHHHDGDEDSTSCSCSSDSDEEGEETTSDDESCSCVHSSSSEGPTTAKSDYAPSRRSVAAPRSAVLGSGASSEVDSDSTNTTASSTQTIVFEDEHGMLLTAREVADRLRRWQRRHHMPNVSADLLPIPIEDLREIIRRSCPQESREDAALMELMLALQQNAHTAYEEQAAQGNGKSMPSADAKAKSNEVVPTEPQNRRNVLLLDDEVQLKKFEVFYGRRPKACCLVA